MSLSTFRHLRATADPDVVRFRTHWSLDWPIFLVASIVGIVVAAFLAPLATPVPAVLGLVSAWMWCRRTTVDRRQRAFGVHLVGSPRRSQVSRPIASLTVRKHVKLSKGTTTITYEILAGSACVADGLAWQTAGELAGELCELLELPPAPVPD